MATAKKKHETINFGDQAIQVAQLKTVAGVPIDVADLTDIVDNGTVLTVPQTLDPDLDETSVVITYTTGDPSITPNGAVTVADGADPTVDELLELAEELIAAVDATNTKVNALIDALTTAGILEAS